MKYILLLTLSFFVQQTLLAQTLNVPFTVLSYNIKGLPHITAPTWSNERYSIMAKILKQRITDKTAPDVVLLQEAFSKDTLPLIQQSGYPYYAQGPSSQGVDSQGSFKKVLNAGLYILSRYPILESGVINFERKICGTWDCQANKGVQYIKIKVPGLQPMVTIFNTHMQSGIEYDLVRIQQLSQTTSQFVLDHTDSSELFIFGGDFNSSPDLASFTVLKNNLPLVSAGETCLFLDLQCLILNNTNPDFIFEKSIDHIFLMKSQTSFVTPLSVVRNFTEMHKGKTLSDHLGYEANFIFQSY